MSHPRAQIRLLMLDVDGVLTDGSIVLDEKGREIKRFHARDGLGIKLWMGLGYEIAIVSGRTSDAVEARMAELGVTTVMQGVSDKRAALKRLCERLGIEPASAACVGDDLPDLPAMRRAGYAIAVADADPRVRACADYVTKAPGGRAAVREAIEHLLERMGRLDEVLRQYDVP